ncbi:hypothetical protein FHY19_001658 [Xanthomonas arboricola]|nr:hypothetical protein [Xanthomonas sp. 4461]
MWSDYSKAEQVNKFFLINSEQNKGHLIRHLDKADIVPLDYRNLTPENRVVVNGWINDLDEIQKGIITIMRWCMGMYISISNKVGWTLPFGMFDCIIESTRELFSCESMGCIKKIYKSLDDEGQSFVILDDVDINCFNLFYENCSRAMDDFLNSSRGKSVRPTSVAGILWNWAEVLRLMREDPRYSEAP